MNKVQIAVDVASLPQASGARVAIVQSKWYREQTDRMVDACVRILLNGGCQKPDVHIVPGALEMPLAVSLLLEQDAGLDAVVCIGAVMKGDTYHFEMVMDACSRGLARVTLDCRVPVIVEVLPVTSIEQLELRSKDDEWNKGIEAAAAALEFVSWRRSITR